MSRAALLLAALLLAPLATGDRAAEAQQVPNPMAKDGSNATDVHFGRLGIGLPAPLAANAPLTILVNPTSAPEGTVSGVKIGISDGTDGSWTNNPYPGHFVAQYNYINSKSGRAHIWAFNPIAEVNPGTDATAWTIEADMGNWGTEVPIPGTEGHKIIIAAVSGGNKKSTAAFTAGASLRDGSNWNFVGLYLERVQDYGIWFHRDVLDTGAAFIGASLFDDSDSVNIFRAVGNHTNGIEWSSATFSSLAIATPGFKVDGFGRITAGSLAAPGPYLTLWSGTNQQLLLSSTADLTTSYAIGRNGGSGALEFSGNQTGFVAYEFYYGPIRLFEANALYMSNLTATGTAAGTLCIDAAGKVFKKTTAGACL